VRDQVSHPFKTGAIIRFRILMFMFLDMAGEDKNSLNRTDASNFRI
jgi:hypothetical protein